MQPKLSVVQLSDTHLFADENKEMFKVNTRDTLSNVISHVRQTVEHIDCVLVTGDLVHDESVQGYQALKEMLQALDAPTFYIPGNHDDADLLLEILEDATANDVYVVERANWKLILLDSSVVGKVEGHLSESVLSQLERELENSEDRHVLIGVHHHVVNINSPWLDELNLINHREFLALIEKFAQVKAVINGHIHQELDRTVNDIRFLGVPSTCFQFKPNREKAEIDPSFAGYRHIELLDDGTINTNVYSVPNGFG